MKRLSPRAAHWAIGIVQGGWQELGRSDVRVRWLTAPRPRRRFWADPSPFRYGGSFYLLCEEFDHLTRLGSIICIQLDHRLEVVRKDRVISAAWHLSYPNVFEHAGELLCTVESAAARKVSVYRMGRSPFEWTHAFDLLDDVPLLDPTLYHDPTGWWLFGTPVGTRNSELHLWSAPEITGPWIPHRQNPVKVDRAGARPAGPLLHHEGMLLRPAQDCAGSYGRRVVLNEVRALTAESFEEAPCATVEPFAPEYPGGLHTLAELGGYVVFDGMRRELRPLSTVTRLYHGIRRRAFGV